MPHNAAQQFVVRNAGYRAIAVNGALRLGPPNRNINLTCAGKVVVHRYSVRRKPVMRTLGVLPALVLPVFIQRAIASWQAVTRPIPFAMPM